MKTHCTDRPHTTGGLDVTQILIAHKISYSIPQITPTVPLYRGLSKYVFGDLETQVEQVLKEILVLRVC